MRGAVPEEDLERTAAAVFDSAAQKVSDVVSVELELSSELQTKHGAVVESMQRAIKQAVDESGAFTDVNEDTLAEYVVDTSKLFADQVLAEATQRNVPIEEVVKASDIVYENGEIRLKSQTEGGESRVLASSSVNVEGELNQLPQDLIFSEQNNAEIELLAELQKNNAGKNLQEKDFDGFVENQLAEQEKQRINEIDIYDAEDFLETSLEEANQEIEDDPEINSFNRDNPFSEEEFIEYARNRMREGIDEYVRETRNTMDSKEWERYREEFSNSRDREIFFDGYQNLVKNILENNGFYVHEGKSRVSDSRYLEVYESEDAYNNGEDPLQQIRISDHSTHKFYGNYLNLDTNQDIKTEIQKLVDNIGNNTLFQGTWDAGNDNIYYQRAYAGSRVDYDKPSLEAIGSGEGNQAHGWGLYYALDKDVAEKYRKSFTNDNIKEQYKGKEVVDWYDEDTITFAALRKIIDNNMDKEEALRNQELIIDKSSDTSAVYYDEDILAEQKAILQRIEEINVDDIVIEKPKGQVHEVEIPENPYLLDEQLEFNEQSEYVKEKLRELLHDNIFSEYVEEGQTLDDFVETEITDWELGFTGGNIYDRLSNLLGSDQSASSFLERYGIKGITYNGRQDGRAFVIFNSNDVEVIQKFYQEQSVEQAFSPTNRDKNTYISDLRAVERGEDTRIRVGELPIVYRELGLSAGMVRTNKDVIFKDTIGKHDVSQTVVDNLPQLFADPIMVFESSTKENRLLAVVNAQDKNGNQIVVAISPNTKGERGYHFIPSFYGKDNFNNFLNKNIIAGNLKYLKSSQALDSHQLWPQVKTLLNSLNNNILHKSDIVNSFMQQKPQPKGLFDANKGVIKIFESADFSTLPHELAHYWLDNMWHYVRSGNASEKYRQRWNVIANWLNVKHEQAFLTRGQQEKFARGYEQYLLNGNLPTPIIKGAFDDYDRWLKRVYGDMNRLNVRHIDYKKASRCRKGV